VIVSSYIATCNEPSNTGSKKKRDAEKKGEMVEEESMLVSPLSFIGGDEPATNCKSK